MTNIYIIMQLVDLGGHPQVAFTDLTLANADVIERNKQYRAGKIATLLTHGHYTQEMAEKWVDDTDDKYYIETIELK